MMKYLLVCIALALVCAPAYAATEADPSTRIAETIDQVRGWAIAHVITPVETFRLAQADAWEQKRLSAAHAAGVSAADDLSEAFVPHRDGSAHDSSAHIGAYVWYATVFILAGLFGRGIIFYTVAAILILGVVRAIATRVR